MGDRCWLGIQVHPEDAGKLQDIIGDLADESTGSEEEAEHGYIHLQYYEANYAFYDELCDAASQGVRFLSHNSSGGEFGAGATVGWDGGFYEISTDNDGSPVVSVLGDGTPHPRQLQGVVAWQAAEAALAALFSENCALPTAKRIEGIVPLSEWKTCDKKPDG